MAKQGIRPWGIIIQPEKEQPIPMLGQIIDPLLSNDRAFQGSCLYFFFSFTDSLSSKSFQFRHKMKQNMLAYQLQTHMYKKLCFFIVQGIKCGNLTQSFSTPTCSQAPSNKKI